MCLYMHKIVTFTLNSPPSAFSLKMWIFGHWVQCHDNCMLDPVLSLPPQGNLLSVPRFPYVLSPIGDTSVLLGVGSCRQAGLWCCLCLAGCLTGLFWRVGVFGVWGSKIPQAGEWYVLQGMCDLCLVCHAMGSGFPCGLSLCPLCWVTGPKLSIWGHTALAPIFWVCCHPGPPSSTPS